MTKNPFSANSRRIRLKFSAVFACLVVAAVVISIYLWYSPVFDSQSYYSEIVSISFPPHNVSTGQVTAFLFHGVTFKLQFVGAYSPAGGGLNGSVSEYNGHTYNFAISGIPGQKNSGHEWISPDRVSAVKWYGNETVELMVEK